jgi:hypothetical protein
MAGAANDKRVHQWFQDKKADWYAVLADLQMQVPRCLFHKSCASV